MYLLMKVNHEWGLLSGVCSGVEHSWWSAGEGKHSVFIYRKESSPERIIILIEDALLRSVPPGPLTPCWWTFPEPRSSYLRLRCAGVLQGPKNLRWFMGAEGGHLFTASSHGRICDVGKAKWQAGLFQQWALQFCSARSTCSRRLFSPLQPLVIRLPLPSTIIDRSAGPTIRATEA